MMAPVTNPPGRAARPARTARCAADLAAGPGNWRTSMARLIHTSDWHLGRTLHGESLLAHQGEFLDWLLTEAVARQADAVVVSGDVYDRAVPPVDAVTLL